METIDKKGKLLLSDKNSFNKYNDCEKWFIARIPFENMSNYNIEWKYELAPSHDLFTWFLSNRFKEDWFEDYIPQYIKQIKNDTNSIAILNLLKFKLDSGINVMLICHCKDFKCHRSIIGKLFKKKGYIVERV